MDMPQQPQTASYPGFSISEAGLSKLHQLVGKLVHQTLEQEGAIEQGRVLLERAMKAALPVSANADDVAPADDAPTPLGRRAKGAG